MSKETEKIYCDYDNPFNGQKDYFLPIDANKIHFNNREIVIDGKTYYVTPIAEYDSAMDSIKLTIETNIGSKNESISIYVSNKDFAEEVFKYAYSQFDKDESSFYFECEKNLFNFFKNHLLNEYAILCFFPNDNNNYNNYSVVSKIYDYNDNLVYISNDLILNNISLNDKNNKISLNSVVNNIPLNKDNVAKVVIELENHSITLNDIKSISIDNSIINISDFCISMKYYCDNADNVIKSINLENQNELDSLKKRLITVDELYDEKKMILNSINSFF